MIYISSSAVKTSRIDDAVRILAAEGFKNIELSGGTEYYKGYSEDLYSLKEEYGLNLLLHNYFPPPKKHFVLNLASLNNDIYYQSMDHLKKAIDLSVHLDAEKYAFHSGYLIDITLDEVGKVISNNNLFDINKAMDRFVKSITELKAYANNEVELYIENNVVSLANYLSFNLTNPFFFTYADEYFNIRKKAEIKPLIDMAHLYVSCKTLGKNFDLEFEALFDETDYIHLSANDGTADRNESLQPAHPIITTLKKQNLKDKTLTLEIYDNIENIKKSYKLLEEIIYAEES